MNVKLLRQVRVHILKEPRRFYMSSYVCTGTPGSTVRLDGIRRELASCGMAACIGGWASLLAGIEPLDIGWNTAKRALRLTDAQAGRLFIVHNWPKTYYKRWAEATLSSLPALEARAKIAANRISYFIRTKGKQ